MMRKQVSVALSDTMGVFGTVDRPMSAAPFEAIIKERDCEFLSDPKFWAWLENYRANGDYVFFSPEPYSDGGQLQCSDVTDFAAFKLSWL